MANCCVIKLLVVVLGVANWQQISSEVVEHHETRKLVIPIVKHNFEQTPHGYQYSYETGNDIHVEEYGYLKNTKDVDGKDEAVIVKQGSFSYRDDYGNPIVVKYIADENGFQAFGDHLPTPPPVPHEIAKTLHQDESVHQIQQPQYRAYEDEDEDTDEQQEHQ